MINIYMKSYLKLPDESLKIKTKYIKKYIGVIAKSLIAFCVNSYISNNANINIYEILLMKLQFILGFTMEK